MSALRVGLGSGGGSRGTHGASPSKKNPGKVAFRRSIINFERGEVVADSKRIAGA